MSQLADLRLSTFCPGKPVVTEKNIPDQSGKVFIVTGGTGGLGTELINILYSHNAKIYVTARSEGKAKEVISEIKAKYPKSTGELVFLKLVLDDLTTIKASADEFLSKEKRLNVLWNNAGVMVPPQGSKSKQGYELQYGTNNLGHHLFVHFLTPILRDTAAVSPPNSVRVIWVASSAADNAPHPAIDYSNMDYHNEEGIWVKYSRSKAGTVLQSAEYARITSGSGIISLSLNPGNFVTNLQKSMPALQLAMFKLIAHEPIKGAYTQLFAGLGDSITAENNGGWVAPFGKIEPMRKDLADPAAGKQYWDWCEEQVRPYM